MVTDEPLNVSDLTHKGLFLSHPQCSTDPVTLQRTSFLNGDSKVQPSGIL